MEIIVITHSKKMKGEFSQNTPLSYLIPTIIEKMGLPTKLEGKPIIYKLAYEATGKILADHETLKSAGVLPYDVLRVMQKVVQDKETPVEKNSVSNSNIDRSSCSHCGRANPSSNKVCGGCGKPISQSKKPIRTETTLSNVTSNTQSKKPAKTETTPSNVTSNTQSDTTDENLKRPQSGRDDQVKKGQLEWYPSHSHLNGYRSALEYEVDRNNLFVSTEPYSGSDEEIFLSLKKEKLKDTYLIKLECVKCDKLQSVRICPNCEYKIGFYRVGYSKGVAGLFCTRCDQGFTSWKCTSCGTNNPVSKTAVTSKKIYDDDCFIATAVYGSYSAPEVITLRKFRDEMLLSSVIGQLLVKFYYQISPPVAHFLNKNNRLNNIARNCILTPFVKLIAIKFSK